MTRESDIESYLVERVRDMLEALQRMEVAFTPLAKDSTLANLIDEARAAIAKATGVAKENFKSEAGFENKPADSFKARAQEQEPVAWRWPTHNGYAYAETHFDDEGGEPLYAAPVRTKDLTDGELTAIWGRNAGDWLSCFRAVIAADRSKNK